MSYQAISERGRMLQDEYLDRRARERVARIPPSKPELGPDWHNMAGEMIERVRALKRFLSLTSRPEHDDN